MGDSDSVRIASKHPLIASDPLLKAQQSKNDNNCLHWMAMGVCGYKESGKCRYAHPAQYEARNFLCPALSKKGECVKVNCAYCHDPEKLPSQSYNKEQFEAWEQAKSEKQDAFVQWIANKNQRDNAAAANWNQEGQTTNQDLISIDNRNQQSFASML